MGTNNFQIGARQTGSYYDGQMDEVMLFSRALTATEVGNLYDYGNPEGSLVSNFTLTATDAWTGNAVNNITVTADGDTYTNETGNTVVTDILTNQTSTFSVEVQSENHKTRTYNDVNASENNTLSAGLVNNDNYDDEGSFNVTDAWTGEDIPFNLTINNITYTTSTVGFDLSSTGYYPATYVDYDYSTLLNASLNASLIRFRAFELITENELEANITVNDNTKNLKETFNLAAGDYTITASKTGYFNQTQNITVNPLDNKTVNITGLYDTIINITGYNSYNDTVLEAYNTTLYADEYTYTAEEETTTGSTTIPAVQGLSYNATLNSNDDYEQASQTITPNTTTYHLNLSVNPRRVIFYFYDEQTWSLIDSKDVTLEVIGESYADNYATSDGEIKLDLPIDDYTVRYDAEAYDQREFFFEYDKEYFTQNLTLLVNDSDYQQVTFTIYDSLRNRLSDAILKILKYTISTNTYNLVSTKKTNFEGVTQEYLEINGELYKFIIEYDGEQVYTSTPSQVQSTEISLYANTLESGFDSLFERTSLWGEIEYDNLTDLATYTFTDGDQDATKGCLYIHRIESLNRVQTNSSCTSGHGGSVVLQLPLENATYDLRGYIFKNGEQYYITQKIVDKTGKDAFKNIDGLLSGAIIVIVSFFLGWFAIELAIISAGFSTMILSITGLIAIPLSITAPIFVVCLVLSFVIAQQRGVIAG